MAKPKLHRTYSTFIENSGITGDAGTAGDPVQDVPGRANEVRRDTDTVKTPRCTIYDIDYAIMWYIRNAIRPQIIENDNTLDVPLSYANGEKWSQIQKHGYMRDSTGKLMTPLMTLRRSTITERDMLKKLDVNLNPAGNAQLMKNKYTLANKYDRFSMLQNSKPTEEFFVTAVPEFIDVAYELFIWAEYVEQLNSIIEQIMPTGGFAWGDTWKFTTYIQDYTFETMNDIGQDRMVRATLPLLTKGTLLMQDELRQETMKKAYSVKRISFKGETETFNANVTNPPPEGYTDNTNGNFKKLL